jgi:hypothetical protein
MQRWLIVLIVVAVSAMSPVDTALAERATAAAPVGPGVHADFNGDGAQDLAVGVVSEAVGPVLYAGGVNVLYGAPGGGLSGAGSQFFTQDTAGIEDTAELDDRFGDTVAVGDFDGDGIDDLAVGAPGERVDDGVWAGAVNVIYGSARGLNGGRASQLFTQGSLGVGREPAASDFFGQALATGDLDGDGADDLAIGSPQIYEDVDPGPGLVNVIYGSATGLAGGRASQLFTQDSPGVGSDAEQGDQFGTAVTIGDFNASGTADLAVGAPGEDVGTVNRAGAINVLFGSPTGLTGAGQLFHQGVDGVVSDPEAHDTFGGALAAANFGRSGHVDLAVGAPGESAGTVPRAGAVNILSGSASGLVGPGSQLFHQGVDGIGSDPENNDQFGSALVAGDFDGDRTADLSVGVPDESAGTVQLAGSINVLFGGTSGLAGAGSQLFHQGSGGVVSDPEYPDRFGWALAAGDFNADRRTDLAVGVPGESVGAIAEAGAINVLSGSPNGLAGPGSQLFHQDVAGIGDAAEEFDRFGESVAAPGV